MASSKSKSQISISGKKVPTMQKFPYNRDVDSKEDGSTDNHSRLKGNADNVISW